MSFGACQAHDKDLAKGVGAVTVDGKMIEVPVVELARPLLDRDAAIPPPEKRRSAPSPHSTGPSPRSNPSLPFSACGGGKGGGYGGDGLVTWKLWRVSMCRSQFCSFGCSAIGSRPSATRLKK
jgi:hypothetical protein